MLQGSDLGLRLPVAVIRVWRGRPMRGRVGVGSRVEDRGRGIGA